MTVRERRRPFSAVDYIALLAFTAYALGGLFVLAQGALTVAASASPDLHESLHVMALGRGLVARVARRVADASHSVPSWLQISIDYALSLFHIVLAFILVRTRPRDRTARLLALSFIGVAGVFNLTSQAALEELPFTPLEDVGQTIAHVVAGVAYMFALLLFPDGRPVPRWGMARLVPLYLSVLVAAILISLRLEGSARPASLLLFFGLLIPSAGAAAAAYRIRHTADVTGQAQARLLFWALLPSVAFGLFFLATNGLAPVTTVLAGRNLSEPPVALYRFFQPAFVLIPVALFAGMLRYRLWDIERLLNRTTVYATATIFLAGVYALFVVLVQVVLGRVAASPLIDSKPAVAITTLLLVSAFRPSRSFAQQFLDRRFNRRRYNAQVTIERFSDEMSHADSLDDVLDRVERILHEVFEPRSVGVWAKIPPRPD